MGSKKNVSRTAATKAKRTRTPEAESFLKRLGSAIGEIRREQGLYQEQLGARAGIPGSRIGEIERGNVNAGTARIAAIAAGLNVSTAALLKRAEVLAMDERATNEIRARAAENLRGLDVVDLDLAAALLARLARVKP